MLCSLDGAPPYFLVIYEIRICYVCDTNNLIKRSQTNLAGRIALLLTLIVLYYPDSYVLDTVY